ncbi:MAG: hypothetical protein HZB53_09795 [Chloroflexi bacterium]|nr:hypothetical protein [Chloroflexota bacterium]
MSAPSDVSGSVTARPSSDDRVYPLVRIVAVLVMLVLVLAVIALYRFPDQTDVDFAWTIRPRMSAMVIGAGYLMGIVYFGRVATSPLWHRVSSGFLPISAFCVVMVLATLMHLDRFHSGTLQFWMWAIIYAVTPFLVPGLWWWNHREDNGKPEPHDAEMPRMLRIGAAVAGAGVGVAGVAFFAMPDLAIGLWPWTITPLLARVYGGWMMLRQSADCCWRASRAGASGA